MKKFFLLLSFIFISFLAFSQTIIQMEEYGGVYRIPCTVNGSKMKLVFDTGASNVCLSQSIAEYLLDNEYIKPSDFIETGQTIVADGKIVDHLKINLRDIEIAGLHLINVPAVVLFEQQTPLLLGQSAIQQLGTVTINGNQLIIHNGLSETPQYTEDEIQRLSDEAMSYAQNKLYALALDNFTKLYEGPGLTPFEMYTYLRCLNKCDRFQDAIRIGKGWLNQNYKSVQKCNIACCVADAYYDMQDYNNAIYYYQMAIASTDDPKDIAFFNCSLGDAYDKKGNNYEAIKAYDRAISVEMSAYHITETDIINGRCSNDSLGYSFYSKACALGAKGDTNDALFNTGLAALCGYDRAKRMLTNLGYTTQSFLNKFYPNR